MERAAAELTIGPSVRPQSAAEKVHLVMNLWSLGALCHCRHLEPVLNGSSGEFEIKIIHSPDCEAKEKILELLELPSVRPAPSALPGVDVDPLLCDTDGLKSGFVRKILEINAVQSRAPNVRRFSVLVGASAIRGLVSAFAKLVLLKVAAIGRRDDDRRSGEVPHPIEKLDELRVDKRV